jgi:cell division protein FtsL
MVRRKFAKKEILLAGGCVVLAIGTLTFYIWQQSTLIMLGYRTSGLERKINGLNEDIRKLETEKASLLALDKVEKIARDELHLESPRQDQIIYEGLPKAEDR